MIALLILATLLIGCGGGTAPADSGNNTPPPNQPGTPASPAATALVSMSASGDAYGGTSNFFSPNAVSIVVAGRVTWRNATNVSHNITFSGAPAPAATLAPAAEYEQTFGAVGSFPYQCTLHAGMNGTITVVQ